MDGSQFCWRSGVVVFLRSAAKWLVRRVWSRFFAAALAVVGFEYEFLTPLHSLTIAPKEFPRFAVFLTFVFILALLSGAQHKITQSLRRARDELDGAVRKLTQTNAALRSKNVERERAQKELRESEQRFRDFAETGSDWLWETGPDHRFTRTSEHLKSAGIEPETHIGQTRWEIGSDLENEAEKWTAHVAAHELREPFRDFVYSLIRPDGSTMYVKTSGRPVFDEHGRFLGYRGIGSDITAEVQGREAERALRQAQTELAHVTRANIPAPRDPDTAEQMYLSSCHPGPTELKTGEIAAICRCVLGS